jgi:hypothetical protein
LNRPEYAHLTVVHLRSPRSARAWLSSLSVSNEEDGETMEQREAGRALEIHI